MRTYTLDDLNTKYDLELDRVVKTIKESKARLVLLQFPDGLKPWTTAVVDFLREKTNAEFLIYFGACFGACDYPVDLEHIKPKIDLIIQFGHNELMPSY